MNSKTLWAMALFAFAVMAHAAEPERVIVSTGDFRDINRLLSEGWTVKHQSVAAASASNQYGIVGDRTIFVFTLSPPSQEVLDANEAKRQAEFQKRREEYLAKKNAYTVEKK